ncbi:MAG: hypothetical protein K6U87_10290 [Firmicutes bacterium]|nr:hypothetical protein [Bacillota bacterium]
MSHPLLPPENDRDAIANLWPRMAHAESALERLDREQSRLADAVQRLQDEIQRTKEHLAAKLDDHQRTLREELSQRLGAIDQHLANQDDTLSQVREQVASARAQWPQGAVIAVSAAATLAVSLVVALVAHVHF